MLAECKPSNALIGSEPFTRLPSARRAFFLAPRLGMTRRVSRAGVTPAAFLCPVRFQIRYGWPLRRSRAKSPPRRCLARARCTVKGVLPKNSNLQRIFLSTFLKSSPLPLWNPKFLGARWLFQKSYGTISTKTFVFVRRIPKKRAIKTQNPNPVPRMDRLTWRINLYVGA